LQKRETERTEERGPICAIVEEITNSRLVEVAYRDKIYIKANLVPLEAEFFRE